MGDGLNSSADNADHSRVIVLFPPAFGEEVSMEHIVFFPGPDGAPSFRRLPSLEDAVRFVEHLRNAENVAEVSVHALASVPLSFRPYYRVEVPAGEAVAEVAAEVAPAPEPASLVPAP